MKLPVTTRVEVGRKTTLLDSESPGPLEVLETSAKVHGE